MAARTDSEVIVGAGSLTPRRRSAPGAAATQIQKIGQADVFNRAFARAPQSPESPADESQCRECLVSTIFVPVWPSVSSMGPKISG